MDTVKLVYVIHSIDRKGSIASLRRREKKNGRQWRERERERERGRERERERE